MENVTVEQAISKGRKMLTYPGIAIVFGTIGLGIYLSASHYFEGSEWIIIFFILGGFPLSWLYWSFMVTDWRIWAFENVRNVHHLKKVAIRNNLIWKDGSFFEKTEIRNFEQKEKLKRLEKKFFEKDVFHDDPSVPKETKIFFSKAGIAVGAIFAIAGIGYGIYALQANNFVGGIIAGFVFGGLFLFMTVRKMLAKGAQIIINNAGIQIKQNEFIPWENIQNEELEVRRSGKNTNQFLVLFHNGSQTEIQLDELDTNINKLEKLLQVYRLRFEKNNAASL